MEPNQLHLFVNLLIGDDLQRDVPNQLLVPKVKRKRTTNEGGGLGAKWIVKENRRLVESWINVSTNSITKADHKKLDFWNKVALVYNR